MRKERLSNEILGIDVHKNNYVVSLIDQNLNILDIQALDLKNLMLFIKNNKPKYIGIDYPNGLNKGYMDNEAYQKKLNLNSKYHYNKKSVRILSFNNGV